MRNFGVYPDGSNALRIPDYVTSIALTTSAQGVAVPTTLGVSVALFSADVNFGIAYNSTVGAQTASFSSATSTGCELNPAVRSWSKGGIAELSVIGRAVGYLSIAWFNMGST